MSVEDEALALRAADGDRDAMARLLSAHYDRLHRIAWAREPSTTKPLAAVGTSLRLGTHPPPRLGFCHMGSGGERRLQLRYKRPGARESALMTQPFGPGNEVARFEDAPAEARFGVAAAGFAELLHESPYVGSLTWDAVIAQGLAARGDDPYGYRSEFVQLARAAKAISKGSMPGR